MTRARPVATSTPPPTGAPAVPGAGAASSAPAPRFGPVGWSLVLAGFLLGWTPLASPDIPWHLATGREILARGEVPRLDWYTYASADRPWIDLHWGFQIVVWRLFDAGGPFVAVGFAATCLTLAFALAWTAAGSELPGWAKGLAWCVPLMCLVERNEVRPEVLSAIWLAVWLHVLSRAEERPRLLWCLPVVQVAWLNTHGLFVLGLVVGAAWGAGRLIRAAAGGRLGCAPLGSEPRWGTVAGVGVACGFAAFVGPYGLDGALFPLELFRKFSDDQVFYSQAIGEFAPPLEFAKRYGATDPRIVEPLLAGGVALGSFVLLATRGRLAPERVLIWAAFAYLESKAVRNVSVFGLVCGVATCANLDEWLRRGRERITASDVALPPRRSLLDRVAAAVVLLWGLSIVSGVWNQVRRDGRSFGFREPRDRFAHQAIGFLRDHPELPHRVFAVDFDQAGVVSYRLGAEWKVYMDPRLEVTSRPVHEGYVRAVTAMALGNAGFEPIVRDASGTLPVLLLTRAFPVRAYVGVARLPGWRLVHADPVAVVFVETAVAERVGLAEHPEQSTLAQGNRPAHDSRVPSDVPDLWSTRRDRRVEGRGSRVEGQRKEPRTQ